MKHPIYATKKLGQTVRTYRKKQQLTQADLALLAGVGIRFIVDLEKGKPTLQFEKILQVLAALGVQLNLETFWDKQ